MAINFTDAYNRAKSKEEGKMPEPTQQSLSPTTAGVSTPDTSVPSASTPDARDFAMSSTGDLDLQKYLYESGLQNAFNVYQQDIQNLEAAQKEQLQQAYQVRELSKKYLGEYASNVGMGDVSGNLLDIYSQYASNVGQIDQNFAALEMNLQREYTMERMKTSNEILKTQYQIELAELDEAASSAYNYAFENYANDVQGGLSYLESQKDTMRPQDYEALKGSFYSASRDAVLQNLQSERPYFGFSDIDSQTEKTREQYLEEVKQWLSPEDYTRVQEVLALRDLYESSGGQVPFDTVMGLDPTMFTTDPAITSDSFIFEKEGNRYAVSSESISDDLTAIDNNVTPELLNEQFEKVSGMDAASVPEGAIVEYQGYYRFSGGNWYRMIDIGGSGTAFDNFDRQSLSTWNINSEGQPAGGVEINFNTGSENLDSITFEGKTYLEDTSVGEYSKLLDDKTLDMKGMIAHLNKMFGGTGPKGRVENENVEDFVPKGQIFFYKGKFFVYTEDGKNIRPMKLQTETE
jgi:hypothetical protein